MRSLHSVLFHTLGSTSRRLIVGIQLLSTTRPGVHTDSPALLDDFSSTPSPGHNNSSSSSSRRGAREAGETARDSLAPNLQALARGLGDTVLWKRSSDCEEEGVGTIVIEKISRIATNLTGITVDVRFDNVAIELVLFAYMARVDSPLCGMLPSPQVCLSTLVTVSTMAVLDLYLLEQSMLGRGSRAWPAAWACTAVALGDLGFLLALRFVSAGVASEAQSPRRAFASALWFLFLSLLELKLFFVCQNYRHERRPADPLARKTLTLLLSVGLPSLFLVLTGAEHITPAHRKQEVRARLLWVALDLLDVLDLQAGLWEEAQSGAVVPLWVDGVVFFYCYVLLLLLPCVSLTELALPGLRRARREAVYPWLSLFAINVMMLGLRAVGVLWYRDPRISTVFVGKNVLALGVKLRSAWDVHRNSSSGEHGEGGEGGGRNQRLGIEAEQVAQEQGGITASTRDHTLLRTHGQSLIRLDHADSSVGSAYISQEL